MGVKARMFSCAPLGACLFGAATTFGGDSSGTFMVLGPGNTSCGKIVAEFKGDLVAKQGDIAWVTGYLTALNQFSTKQRNVAEGTDPEAWALWINNYCTAHPLENLATATNDMVFELLKRPKPTKVQ